MNHFQTRTCANHPDIEGDLAIYKSGSLVGCLEEIVCDNEHEAPTDNQQTSQTRGIGRRGRGVSGQAK